MLMDSFLENLNYLLPPCSHSALSSSKSLTAKPLQVICATGILKSRDVFVQYAEELPPSLFPLLLQIAIEQNYIQYLNTQGSRPVIFGSIGLLIEYWPYETLILREHLNFKQDERNYPVSSSLNLRKEKFQRFIQDLVKVIIHDFVPWSNARTKNQALIKLNISQLGFSIEEVLLNRVTSFVKEWQHSHVQSTKRPLELVCDITINDTRKFPEFLSFVSPPFVKREKSLPLTLSFETVTICSVPESLVMEFLSCMLGQEKLPNYLKVCMCFLNEGFLEYLGMKFSSLKGLAVKCILPNRLDFTPLLSFNHLRQLDVSGMRSTDGWGILSHLPCDLYFLRMVGCVLKTADLIGLSRHSKSLLQVDLSENSMADEDMYSVLFEFICSLHNVEILALESCRLGQIPHDPFKSFICQFRTSCPKLKVLQFDRNDFSTHFISSILSFIAEKRSLRLLSLTFPSDVYISDNYEVVKETKNRLASTLESWMKLSGSTLRIDWGEESNFSHWYYAF